jgi:general secretion pathway protein L
MIQNQARLFGLDLSALVREWRAAWLGLWRGPWRSWLAPAVSVQLLLPDGATVVWRGPGKPLLLKPDARALARARFFGVVLPEELLLRRSWILPPLADGARQAAIELELRSLSPFGPNDAVSAQVVEPADGGRLQVHAALISRNHVTKYLAEQGARLGKVNDPEVWVSLGDDNTHWQNVAGFGGGRREQAATVWAAIAGFVLFCCLGMAAAMAFTPTLQLRERALQAQESFAALQAKAAPAIQQRESLVRHADMLGAVQRATLQQMPTLQVLDLITRSLPDGTFLTSFQLEGDKVRLAGQTDNAANLMKQLGSQVGLQEVKAPTAAVRVSGTNRETFTLEFSLDPKTWQGSQP